MKLVSFAVLTCVLLTLLPLPTICQLFSVEYLYVKLPLGNCCPSPVFNGDDTIYLLGGRLPSTATNILKFSISSETLEEVGQLPSPSHWGSVQSDSFGSIFYFSGGPDGDEVYSFNPTTNVTSIVARLPYNSADHVSIKYNDTSNTVFILGGYDQGWSLLAFDMVTLNYSTLSYNLPFSVTRGVSIPFGNKAFIFDNANSWQYSQAIEFNLETYNLSQVGPSILPLFSGYPSAVSDGNFGYIFGGYRADAINPTNGIFQFDPVTHENTFLPVTNWPVDGSNYYNTAPASVYVRSRDRIYFFGGQSYAFKES